MPDGEQNQYQVSIGRHTFDPAETRSLRARRLETRPERAPDPNDTRIVQFHRILTAPDIERIRAEYGLALTAYVPNLAYVERVDAATRRRLGRDPLVRLWRCFSQAAVLWTAYFLRTAIPSTADLTVRLHLRHRDERARRIGAGSVAM